MEPQTNALLPDYYGTSVPPEAKKWSWGGFLLTWIWAIGNKVWIGLLALLPFPFIGLGVAIYLGVKGRELAWRSRQWPSVEAFNRNQRKWAVWGFVVLLGSIIISIASVVAIVSYGNSHPDTTSRLRDDLSLSSVSNSLSYERSYSRDGNTSITLPIGWQSMAWGKAGFSARPIDYGSKQTILVDRGDIVSLPDESIWQELDSQNVVVDGRLGVLTTYQASGTNNATNIYRYVLTVSSSTHTNLTAIAESEAKAWNKNQKLLRQSLMSIEF